MCLGYVTKAVLLSRCTTPRPPEGKDYYEGGIWMKNA